MSDTVQPEIGDGWLNRMDDLPEMAGILLPMSFLMMAVGLNCSAGGATLFSLFRGRGEKKDMSRSFGNSI